jgi:hypothetical protein
MLRNIIFMLLLLPAVPSAQELPWPAKVSHALASNFGEFRDNHFHMGIDIKTNGREGFPVTAVADGYISRMVANYNGYGRALYLTTENGQVAVYGHLERFNTTLEDVLRTQQEQEQRYHIDRSFTAAEFPVRKGDIIGYTGNTGASFAPHLHFELRNGNHQPLNPLTHGLPLSDHRSPVLTEIALVPLTPGTWINANPLPQTFPLFRDRSGRYLFPDTLNVSGTIGLALRAVDRREGADNRYQVYRLELVVDGEPRFRVTYDKLDYNEGHFVNTVLEFPLQRLNLGEFHKLYRLVTDPLLTIHDSRQDGRLQLPPGYHTVSVQVQDQAGNQAVAQGVLFVHPPARISVEAVEQTGTTITFAARPAVGAVPVETVTIYRFTPYGLADARVEPLSRERQGKALLIQVPRDALNRGILQFIGNNRLGAVAFPVHWSAPGTEHDLLEVQADLELSQGVNGLYLQIQTSAYVTARVSARLHSAEASRPITLTQVQPTVYLSPLLPPEYFREISRVEVLLADTAADAPPTERVIVFEMDPVVATPGNTVAVLSLDRLCSMRTTAQSLYDTTVLWIEEVETGAPVKHGTQLSKVYQLQPFALPLRDSVQIGIRYGAGLSREEHLGIYYYDAGRQRWSYLPTRNRRKRQVLTASIHTLEAITIIQDETPPIIQSTFPGQGGFYHYQDVEVLRVQVTDALSGIDAREASLIMTLDGQRLPVAYQPIKQELSYRLDVPLDSGEHEWFISVADRTGNITSKTVKFTVN